MPPGQAGHPSAESRSRSFAAPPLPNSEPGELGEGRVVQSYRQKCRQSRGQGGRQRVEGGWGICPSLPQHNLLSPKTPSPLCTAPPGRPEGLGSGPWPLDLQGSREGRSRSGHRDARPLPTPAGPCRDQGFLTPSVLPLGPDQVPRAWPRSASGLTPPHLRSRLPDAALSQPP